MSNTNTDRYGFMVEHRIVVHGEVDSTHDDGANALREAKRLSAELNTDVTIESWRPTVRVTDGNTVRMIDADAASFGLDADG